MIIYSKASLNEIKDRVAQDAFITPSYNGYGAAGNRLDLSSLNGVELNSSLTLAEDLPNLIDGNLLTGVRIIPDLNSGFLSFKFALKSKISQFKVYSSIVEDENIGYYYFEYSDDGEYWYHDHGDDDLILINSSGTYSITPSNDFHHYYRLKLSMGKTKEVMIYDIKFKISGIFDDVQYPHKLIRVYRDSFGFLNEYNSIGDKMEDRNG